MADIVHPIYSSNDLDSLLERIGDAKYVFLGESSHGTHEFYTWRSAITKRLIKEKGFNFIAVEGDWPDCYELNRYIKGYSNQDMKSHELLHNFERWPTWMWANWEIAALMDWLKEHNSKLPNEKKVGFYGLDVYSLWDSMENIVTYLEKNDPEAAVLAKKALKCFDPYQRDEYRYARAQAFLGKSCREPLVKLLAEVRKKAHQYNDDIEASLNAEQNAVIALNAEKYYSNMMSLDDNTWNIRDQHMMETLNRLLNFYGVGSKSIVWAHNTHIGDARYTDMKDAGMFNIGQLAREEKGRKDVVLVGFGTYTGKVIAGKRWGAPMEVMHVPPAIKGSIECQLHHESPMNRIIVFDKKGYGGYKDVVLHRAIGVVYNPEREKRGNYVPTKLNERYDAFIYLDRTSALHPLHLHPDSGRIPETYPFNF